MRIAKFLLAAMLAGAALVPSYAQNGAAQAAGEDKNCANCLNLTSDQKALLKDLDSRTSAERQRIRDNAALSDAERSAQLKALNESYEASFRSLLTTDQIKTLDSRGAMCARKKASTT